MPYMQKLLERHGASRARTGDLGVANAALFQLSYGPRAQAILARPQPYRKPRSSSRRAWRPGSGESSSTTPSVRPPRRATPTKQRPAAFV